MLVEQVKHDIIFGLILPNAIARIDSLTKNHGANEVHLNQALALLCDQQLIERTQYAYQMIPPTQAQADCLHKSRIEVECQILENAIAAGNVHWL